MSSNLQEQPLVSIIIPTYKHAHLLGRAIDSVISQSYQNWELIVIDNSSNDGSEELVSSYQNKKILFFSIDNKGIIARSRNLGIMNSKGQWIAFLDADDWWTPLKLEASINAAKIHDVDLVYHDLKISKYLHQKIIFKKLKSTQYQEPVFQSLLQNGNMIFNSSVLVKKESLERVNNLDESSEKVTWEDYDLWLRLADLPINFLYLKESLGFYWMGGGNTSNPKRVLENLSSIFDHYIAKNLNQKPFWWTYSQAVNLIYLGFYIDGLKYLRDINIFEIKGTLKIKVIFYFFKAWAGSKFSNKTYNDLI
jgi:glycosyltransferase involved in cell wall biosynthesis